MSCYTHHDRKHQQLCFTFNAVFNASYWTNIPLRVKKDWVRQLVCASELINICSRMSAVSVILLLKPGLFNRNKILGSEESKAKICEAHKIFLLQFIFTITD